MSRQILLTLFGAVATLLVVAIGWEIFAPAGDADQAAPSAAHAPAPPAAPTGTASSGAEISGWVGTILSRPLFAVSRKPDAAAVATGQSTGDEPASDLPRLTGIEFYGVTKRALFQPVGDVPPLVVAEGELVSGWRVDKIERASVTVNGPKGPTILETKFDENMVPPSPQVPPRLPGANVPRPGQPGQPGQPPRPNALPPNPGQPPRPAPGQPTAVPPRPPFIPQQRPVPQPNGAPVPPGAR